MKKMLSLIGVVAFLLTSCTGDTGPAGPPGQDGGIVVSSAFEISVNFNADNDYQHTESYGFEVLQSDVALAYVLWEADNGKDVWRLMPQSVSLPKGELIYNYDFTQTDIRFFLDGSVNYSELSADWTQNQVFRVVVIPADNIDGIDINNYNSVIQATQIQSFDVR